QGAGSAGDIVRGLARGGGIPGVEAVMLVRGGGSREDLNPFDEEEVVRAIRGCPVPVITGLGHQVDRTLADLAADMDAPTPSAAAEALFPSRIEIIRELRAAGDKMARIVFASVMEFSSSLQNNRTCLARAVERSAIIPAEGMLVRLGDRMVNAVKRGVTLSFSSLENAASSLDALSPLKVLSRGFTSCSTPDGGLVSSVSEVSPGDGLNVRFKDGRIITKVAEIYPD
ncbi:exodeoxyribonuclease VII large subunit, partial [Candidatus Oleimmundimicrobium sp.]|uniref:exodeoxyribonuclease VII large subunit n=1 Tax=Candidatus Oleimmundimicrobium sp. TaxID=3060597 RepID=UPI00271B2CBA